MKQKLLLTLGIILLMTGLTISPARAAKGPSLQSVMNAIIALQNSVNNLESFQGNMPPAWYQTLPSDQRFLLVMGGQAVLDRETGLVWEKSPNTNGFPWSSITTTTAVMHCIELTTGDRLGWRLPTIQELASLVDLSVSSGIKLPSGHPFLNVQTIYWSATTIDGATSLAWTVDFFGFVAPGTKTSSNVSVWCVRGGQGVNPQ